ncbi:MAG: hypothetical protein O7G31_04905 [Calditrichaeota bacterium]|nr:hypothetical protein [Calditrichota bacterium]
MNVVFCNESAPDGLHQVAGFRQAGFAVIDYHPRVATVSGGTSHIVGL